MTDASKTPGSTRDAGAHSCQSCTMTIESGDYCEYCVDDHGQLVPFEEFLSRASQFARRRDPGLTEEQAMEQTLQFMSQRPAWKDHPELRARLG